MSAQTPLLLDVQPTTSEKDTELQSKLAQYVRLFTIIGFAITVYKVLKFATAFLSLGDFLCFILQCLIAKSVADGELFGKDIPSTATIFLYLCKGYSTPTFLITLGLQLFLSQNTRDTYRFLLTRGEKQDQFWEAMYVIAQVSAAIQLEYRFWAKNLYVTPMANRDELWGNIRKLAIKRVEAVEKWRLEKQPGYKETQTPEVLQQLHSWWRQVTARAAKE